jgi:hypothetical protein
MEHHSHFRPCARKLWTLGLTGCRSAAPSRTPCRGSARSERTSGLIAWSSKQLSRLSQSAPNLIFAFFCFFFDNKTYAITTSTPVAMPAAAFIHDDQDQVGSFRDNFNSGTVPPPHTQTRHTSSSPASGPASPQLTGSQFFPMKTTSKVL